MPFDIMTATGLPGARHEYTRRGATERCMPDDDTLDARHVRGAQRPGRT
jgi:hypothetical protein